MKIWLINPHDALPGEQWGYTRGRLVAEYLANLGHDVTWWSGTFAHASKTVRTQVTEERRISDRIRIRLVPTHSYFSHLSLDRLRYFWSFARNFYRKARLQDPPDRMIVMTPCPLIEPFCVRLSRTMKIPLISEFRDLWPELFVLAVPKRLRFLAPALFFPFFSLRRYLFRNADAIYALNSTYLEIALKEAGGSRARKSAVIYNGVDIQQVRTWMEDASVVDPAIGKCPEKPDGEIWAIYVGTLNMNSDMDTLWESARRLPPHIKILVAGDGPLRKEMEGFITRHHVGNLVYLGVLQWPVLSRYLRLSDIGISAYSAESTVAFPTKSLDYFVAGLPVVNSLRGEYEKLLEETRSGIQYRAGDPQSLADGILELSTDPEMRRQMSQRAYAAASGFDRNTQFAQYREILA